MGGWGEMGGLGEMGGWRETGWLRFLPSMTCVTLERTHKEVFPSTNFKGIAGCQQCVS